MRSPTGGWQVVEEYESDDLASNSEDKKKRRVEKGKQDKGVNASNINGRKLFMLFLTISFFVVDYCLTYEPILC